MTETGKKKNGRPTVMTAATLKKLDNAFMLGCSELEACFAAGINPDTLRRYKKKNPDYAARIAVLKSSMTYKARQTVKESIEDRDNLSEAAKTARWYLEKTCPEFNPRQEVAIDGGAHMTIEARRDAVSGFLKQFKGKA